MIDLLQDILEYQFVTIPREQNVIADALEIFASLFKIPIYPNKKYEIQVKHRPAVPNNLKHWQFFEDHQQKNRFLTITGEFENCFIDEENMNAKEAEDPILNHIVDKEAIQLRTNSIPKGSIPLDKLFDNNDVAKSPAVKPNNEDVEDVNIGKEQGPKIVKVASKLAQEVKDKYIQLLKRNSNVFAWSYEDLKVYDTNVIRHTSPLKENEKPFRQKLRRLNPLLLPVIDK